MFLAAWARAKNGHIGKTVFPGSSCSELESCFTTCNAGCGSALNLHTFLVVSKQASVKHTKAEMGFGKKTGVPKATQALFINWWSWMRLKFDLPAGQP